MAFHLQLLILLATVWQTVFAITCTPLAASCALLPPVSSASCSSFFSSNKISTSTCTSTSTITPVTVTKTITSVVTSTSSASVTDTRTIQQTKARSSTITTTTLIITSSSTTSTTTSEVVATITVPAAVTKRSWFEKLFIRAVVVPADCSCFLTTTSTKYTTLPTPTTTTTLPKMTAKTVTSTIRTTITISNVGTTLTSISTTFTTYISTYTTTESLTSTTTSSCPPPSDFVSDNNNCGSCGNVCPSGTSCYNSVCAITCASSAVCDVVPQCGIGGLCLCNAIAEGGVVCFGFPNFGCSFQTCSKSTDCPAGQGCTTDTCCPSPFCAPIDNCSNTGSAKFLFRKGYQVAARDGDLSHFPGGKR